MKVTFDETRIDIDDNLPPPLPPRKVEPQQKPTGFFASFFKQPEQPQQSWFQRTYYSFFKAEEPTQDIPLTTRNTRIQSQQSMTNSTISIESAEQCTLCLGSKTFQNEKCPSCNGTGTAQFKQNIFDKSVSYISNLFKPKPKKQPELPTMHANTSHASVSTLLTQESVELCSLCYGTKLFNGHKCINCDGKGKAHSKNKLVSFFSDMKKNINQWFTKEEKQGEQYQKRSKILSVRTLRKTNSLDPGVASDWAREKVNAPTAPKKVVSKPSAITSPKLAALFEDLQAASEIDFTDICVRHTHSVA
ncbi:hypothetical protein HDV04_005412 [Boothiomyces sp. JEL0838]|nr:hypothetical protein HDV04_005412 [Boothiomyces sp. JEL0838]